MRAILIIVLIGIFSSFGYSQKKTSINDVRNIYDEKGDYYFDKKEFKKAIVYFNMAYKKDANNYYSILRKAESYSKLGLYDQAAESYRVIFNTDLYIPNEFRLQYALLSLKNKDISNYEKWMSIYNKEVVSEIEGYLSSSQVRAKMYRDSSFILVENESVLNTPESEIAPAVYKDQVIFASTRKTLDGSRGNGFYNVFTASYMSDGHLGRLNKFSSKLFSEKSEVALFCSVKENRVYFSRGTSSKSGLNSYKVNVPSNVNAAVNVVDFSIPGFGAIGHPAFNSKGTVVYFVSSASGGSGGLDIYSSKLEAGKWSTPQNLGAKINSSKDEMYPYILNDSLLFFTSAGHNSLGGLDLFVVNLKEANASAKNLGRKVNTPYDDYALSFSPEGLTGYFASNRPGGFGKEDIYRLHIIDLKVKLPAYKFKRKSFMEDDKINLYFITDGDQYNISSKDKSGFDFTFKPEEGYKMVIQHENPLASDIIYNSKLTAEQKQKAFLNPKPIQRTEIPLKAGMQYQFTAGMKPISQDFKNAVNEMAKNYQNSGSNTIDFTALAKELLLRKGEVYTIRFVKDNNLPSSGSSKDISSLLINNETIDVDGRTFFIMLPLDIQANFNIKTDVEHFKKNFNPKKVGTVKVDAAPVIKEETVIKEFEGFPILVNTATLKDVAGKRKISAKELTIVPGSMYILTLANKKSKTTKEPEIVIPLTKGVKYDLGTDVLSRDDFQKQVNQIKAPKAGSSSGELIDISVLSKELDMISQEDILFSLVPADVLTAPTTPTRSVLTTLNVDGRKFYVTNKQKIEVKLKLDQNKKINLQTDLNYVKENFVPSTIALDVDTVSFKTNIKNIITDPVFDVIVVNFDLNDYSVRPDAKSILASKVVQVLKGDSRLYVTIKGYSDPLGDAAYNEKLSKNRAQSVKDFLSSNGITESRIRTFSFGETLSLAEGTDWEDLSEEELKKHRKVEIVIYLPKEDKK